MNVWVHKQYIKLQKEWIDHFTGIGYWDKVVWCDNEVLARNSTTHDKSLDLFNKYTFHKGQHYFDCLPSEKLSYLDFASRGSVYGGFERDSRSHWDNLDAFQLLFGYTVRRLQNDSIDLIIFNRAPHYEGDYALYLAAKYLNIKTVILQQSLLPSKFFYFTSLEDFWFFERSHVRFSRSLLHDEFGPGKFEKNLFYMNSARLDNRGFFKQVKKRLSNELKLLKRLSLGPERAFSVVRYQQQKKFEQNENRYYSARVNLNRPFVYFALHLQPELTTSVFGGNYCDQLLAIERVASILPVGWKIFVKENPKQNYLMRGRWFFERISRMPDVQLIPKDFDTHTLLQNCLVAATVTGTVGWEAVSGLKPVVVFGDFVWYERFHGVFRFSPDLCLEQLADLKLSGEQLRSDVESFSEFLGDGIIYPGYEKLASGFEWERNVSDTIGSLEKIIEIV